MATPNLEGFLDGLEPAESIQRRVNERFDALFVEDKHGKLRPYVCTVCDIYLIGDGDNQQVTIAKMKGAKTILSWSHIADPRRKAAIENTYKFDTSKTSCREDLSFLSGMALSPRGSLYRKTGRRTQFGFSCCSRCKLNIGRNDPTIPRHAIANKNYVGCAPQLLRDLNEAELAFLSPVKNYGYCFTHTGGTQKLLKGTCTFMRVERQGISDSVCVLEDLGLTNHVLVLFTGQLTKDQKRRARERSTIRTEKVIPALHWLRENNSRWKDIDVERVREGLLQHEPIVLDRSEEVESTNANLEKEELFTVFYPDGATTPTTGGFDKPGIFKQYVQDMAREGFTVEMQSMLEKKFTKDSEADILLDACLLQYPYGIGGLEEGRLLHDESITTQSDLFEYFEHVSKLSQLEFQTPMFQLIMYSMVSKLRLLKQSRLQLRGKTSAKNMAENFDPNDVISCINHRRMKDRYAGTNVAKKYLKAVDACSKALAHTNEASKAARGNGESMQHHFGMSSVFLTVTYDDENSLLMQVLSNTEIDDGRDIAGMTDAELSERAKSRKKLRVEFPGIAALNFEILFHILTQEVIGWDMKRNAPTEVEGLFGPIYAFSYAVEEQGRKTLHAHMTLWIEGYDDIQQQLFFGATEKEKRLAKSTLRRYHEHIASTRLFPVRKSDQLKAWDHDCTVNPQRDREPPDVICPQALRVLRHRHGHKDSKGVFAMCPHCPKVWTYEDLVSDYLVNVEGIKQEGTIPVFDREVDFRAPGAERKVKNQVPKPRMFAKIMEYQKDRAEEATIPYACINAGHQHHLSCHVSGCFRCQKKGSKQKGHVCGKNCECRYRVPDLPRIQAEVAQDSAGMPWYSWSGGVYEQPLAQVHPKRNTYDLFQNVCCRAISHSKFSCNSNVSCVLDGPIGQYMHKYQEKQNQEEESAEYKDVEKSIRRMQGERVHEDDRKEALRLICRGAFAHNRSNVISPPFASFLTRHSSRFYYSHEFTFCPLGDVVRLHNKQEVGGSLQYTPTGNCFFENAALDYLCRSEELENLSLFDITQQYKSNHVPQTAGNGRRKRQKKNPVHPFIAKTDSYHHPSVIASGPRKGTCAQGFRERDTWVLARISQWMFPDTADFKADITTASGLQLNSKMETYAQLVLSLFMPHRSKSDITVEGSTHPYTQKLQDIWQRELTYKDNEETERIVLFTKEHTTFLQNLQNCRSNSLRYKVQQDPLCKITTPYDSPHADNFANEDGTTEEDIEEDETAYEQFAKELEMTLGYSHTTDEDRAFLPEALNNFEFTNIRNKGSSQCGWSEDLSAPHQVLYEGHSFVNQVRTETPTVPSDSIAYPQTRPMYNVDQIVRLHLRRNQPTRRKTLWQDKTIEAMDANGSVKSVRDWAKAAFSSDARQRRAFEVLTSTFLLTFYEESPEDATDATHQGNNRSKYRQAKKGLCRLRGNSISKNLVCLLHGPGGSGKSTVINAVIAYAQDYCKELGHPYTNRTIIVTAMSGVAATLLNGETTHSVLGLNRGNVQNEEIEEWLDARLLIIDEISFAAELDFEKMHQNLKHFMQDKYWIYGGMNMVFAGDYSQLEPVQRDPIYKDGHESEFFQKAINCYIELDGKWRFINDPAWGDIMKRFREGEPTEDDITTINGSCHVSVKRSPPGTQVASYTNKDRCAINASIFEDYTICHGRDGSILEGACIIFADELAAKDTGTNYVPVKNNSVLVHFYQNVAESDIGKSGKKGGKFDPCLKLYQDCPVMFTKNEDVANGQANGSRIFVKQVHMKGGEEAFELQLDNGTNILGMYASQVKSIEVEHENQDILPRRFQVKSQSWSFTCKMKASNGMEDTILAMKGLAFPIISNNCTTGHKLQGCTVKTIVANDWYYGENWAYVVLSRVRTMAGLTLRRLLSTDLNKYTKKQAMKDMIKKFADTVAVDLITDVEYNQLEATHHVPLRPSTPELYGDSDLTF